MEVKTKRGETEYIFANQYKLQCFHLRLQLTYPKERPNLKFLLQSA